jgi:AcrR family transcriptional regulator
MLTHQTAARTSQPDYWQIDDPPSKRMIMKEALHLFAQKGIEGVTVREIGARAGYTNAALFKFFATKDALALDLFERCYLALFESLSAAARPELPFADRLHGIVTVFVRQMERDPDALLFVQDQLRSMWPRVSPGIRRHSILGLIRATLKQGVRENRVRSTANLNLLIASISGTLQQFARMLSFGEFRGRATAWSGELEQIILRIVSPAQLEINASKSFRRGELQ